MLGGGSARFRIRFGFVAAKALPQWCVLSQDNAGGCRRPPISVPFAGWDHEFESAFLQRRVSCEPDSRGHISLTPRSQVTAATLQNRPATDRQLVGFVLPADKSARRRLTLALPAQPGELGLMGRVACACLIMRRSPARFAPRRRSRQADELRDRSETNPKRYRDSTAG
jgi:hypothetical protein